MKQSCAYNQYDKRRDPGFMKNQSTYRQVLLLTDNPKLLKPTLFSFILGLQAICLKTVENRCNNCQTQIFARFLAPFLAGRPRFYLVGSLGLTIDLVIGLAIDKVILTAVEVAIGLFG